MSWPEKTGVHLKLAGGSQFWAGLTASGAARGPAAWKLSWWWKKEQHPPTTTPLSITQQEPALTRQMAEQESSGSSPAPGTWIVHFEPGSFLEAMVVEEPRNNCFAKFAQPQVLEKLERASLSSRPVQFTLFPGCSSLV